MIMMIGRNNNVKSGSINTTTLATSLTGRTMGGRKLSMWKEE